MQKYLNYVISTQEIKAFLTNTYLLIFIHVQLIPVVSVLYDTNYISCDACARQSMDSDAKHDFLACLKQGLSCLLLCCICLTGQCGIFQGISLSLCSFLLFVYKNYRCASHMNPLYDLNLGILGFYDKDFYQMNHVFRSYTSHAFGRVVSTY